MNYYQVTYKTKSQTETTLWLSADNDTDIQAVLADLQNTHDCADIHAKPISFIAAKDLI